MVRFLVVRFDGASGACQKFLFDKLQKLILGTIVVPRNSGKAPETARKHGRGKTWYFWLGTVENLRGIFSKGVGKDLRFQAQSPTPLAKY